MRGVEFDREVDLPVFYKGNVLPSSFRADFVCFRDLIVELKAIPELTTRENSQVINYLHVTGFTVGLLINFGSSKLEYRRFIDSKTISSD